MSIGRRIGSPIGAAQRREGVSAVSALALVGTATFYAPTRIDYGRSRTRVRQNVKGRRSVTSISKFAGR